MKSVGKARNNGLYRHIRTSKEIIRNLLNDYIGKAQGRPREGGAPLCASVRRSMCQRMVQFLGLEMLQR